MIILRHLSKSFDQGATFAVRDVSLEVAEGETVVLLGSSGSGKTTTLKMINRLIEPTSGDIEVDGRHVLEQDAVELRRSIGYVFQGIGLFPHMTIEENVAIVLRLLGRSREERQARARELLQLVDLDPDSFAERMPGELSGGQQQRVGVARALAADPAYLLMDEPFGALDALTRDTLQQEVLALKERLQKTIVFVTHDIFEALTLANRIAVMHEGRLEQIGTKEEILGAPATDFVRELFEKPAKQLAAFREHME
jgi:osmoprotectant transport system ATP-binding protein